MRRPPGFQPSSTAPVSSGGTAAPAPAAAAGADRAWRLGRGRRRGGGWGTLLLRGRQGLGRRVRERGGASELLCPLRCGLALAGIAARSLRHNSAREVVLKHEVAKAQHDLDANAAVVPARKDVATHGNTSISLGADAEHSIALCVAPPQAHLGADAESCRCPHAQRHQLSISRRLRAPAQHVVEVRDVHTQGRGNLANP
mmetsp:Transcript_25202/g.69281  ORF Transcript_25202/g.69281 Transcript_25202/m.69281 type:complete len:200 (-) Transcript_25202:689-1288(-)